MKVAIVYPPFTKKGCYPLLTQNRQFRFSSSLKVKIYPMIPAMAATFLKENGFEVLYLDGINERLSMEEFRKRLNDFSPHLIMLETKAPIIKEHWKFINWVKEEKDVKFVLVGDHISFFPRESFKNSKVDYCLTGGDYDLSLLKLVKHIKGQGELPRGTYYREKGKIKNTGRFELIKDLDSLPFIDRDLTRWTLYGEAYLYHPCTYILSGRGCGGMGKSPGRCKFCIWQHSFWRCTARLRSPENVVREIKMLVDRYRIREIFDDNESGAIWNKEWLRKFHQEMKKENLIGKVILSSNARADSLNKETCALLKKTGFRLLKVGLESGHNETLKRLNKEETIEEIVEGVKRAKDQGLIVMLTTMVGYPWESEEDPGQTYKVARELMLYKTHFGDALQASVIVPYPGTPLYKEALRNNWLLPEIGEYEKFDMSRPVLKSPSNSSKWCKKIWGIHSEPKFLWKSLISLRSVHDFKLALGGIVSLLGHLRDFE